MSEPTKKYIVHIDFSDGSTFSLFTEDTDEKSLIKNLLENMGPDAVDVISMQTTELIEPNDTFL